MFQRTSPSGSSARRVENANLPAGMIVAVALHAAIIAATLFTFTHTLDIQTQSPPVVPVDLVTLGDKNNIAPMVRKKVEAPPKEEAQPDNNDTAPAPTPQQKAEEAPPPPTESTDVVPVPKPPPPAVVPKQKPPQPEQKKDKFDLDALANMLDKRAPAKSSTPNAKVADRNVKGIGAMNAATADLVSMLYEQIRQCWNEPSGAPRPEDLIVSFRLFLAPDGSIAQQPQLTAQSGSGSYAQAAVEAARRAIYTCAPYKLPQDRYNQWRDVTFTFDPTK